MPNHRADHMDGDFQISFILFWYCCMVSNHVLKHVFGYTMIYCISWDNIMNNAQSVKIPRHNSPLLVVNRNSKFMEIPHHIPRCCPIILRMAKYRKTSAILPQQNPIVFSSRNNMKLRGLRGSAETSVNKYELNTYLGIGHIAENPKMVCK